MTNLKRLLFTNKDLKRLQKKQGHRQGFTRVMISKIRTSAKKAAATEESAAE